ncbi:hypothetical protein vBEliSR6L_70 [Erythrobacter phage vB_EliS_R6L]|nr:hypothetical protein vBEliSR6L_70 [Erythrobacter phage vB_EliS_R6L]
MITDRELFVIEREGSPFTRPPMSREAATAFMARQTQPGWSMRRIPTCRCCGEPAWKNWLCTKHQGRTPCVVEGCRRTTKRWTTYFICGEHWKAYVPPGSPERRVLNRLARTAKKLGYSKTERWPDDLEARWWRAWAAIARRVQRRSTEGLMDEAEIRRMFGWADEG